MPKRKEEAPEEAPSHFDCIVALEHCPDIAESEAGRQALNHLRKLAREFLRAEHQFKTGKTREE